MARLNEPPQPATESIDALKRRFVRQNREIAKANSTQSLRIRTLESEVSRLLSENVTLREQIIKLHYELEGNSNRAALSKVDEVKAKLEAKLLQVGDLVRELGGIQKVGDKDRQARRKSLNRTSPKRSPNQRNWRNALSLSEVTGDMDGRLPPILEDKYFPRRTMDAEEMTGIFADPANLTDSPDFGPPPIAHLDGDPIKFDPGQETPSSRNLPTDNETPQPPLSANLETRKKRRESSHHKEASLQRTGVDVGGQTSLAGHTTATSQTLKTGAKRKLNIRDEDDLPIKDLEKDHFHFNRKKPEARTNENIDAKLDASRPTKAASEKGLERRGMDTITKDNPKESGPAVVSTGRKVLGPKSTNTDPQSPAKFNRVGVKERAIESKDDLAKRIRERNRPKDRPLLKKSVDLSKTLNDVPQSGLPSKLADPPPETPLPPPLDLFSPMSSEPSAARPEGRDTPPPPDLGPDTSTGSFGRASRRPRGSVSYAEPNLRDKMRRPTKELIDAVGAEERARQADLIKKGTMASTIGNVVSKHEEGAEALPIWKTNPAKTTQSQQQRQRAETISPLGKKASGPAADLPASVLTSRRRRTIAQVNDQEESDPAKPASGAGSAIAALVASSQRSKRMEEGKTDEPAGRESRVRESVDRTSIFDFTGSSPGELGTHHGTEGSQDESSKQTRASRRHSNVPATSNHGKGSLSISRRGERGRDGLVGTSGEGEVLGTGIAPELRSVKSVTGVEDGLEELSLRRGERAASRRRSMML